MNTRQLRYVLTIAQERNFTEASKKLFITQPSLSQYVLNLEKEIGTPLFERSVVPLRLTMAGEAYVEMARKVLDMEKQFDHHLKDLVDEQYGKLIVGVTTFRGLQILPRVIKKFTEKYPNFEISICEQMPVQLLEMLEQGELDLCITKLPDNASKFNSVYIMTEELLLAVPSSDPINERLNIMRERRPGVSFPMIDLAELKDVPFIVCDRNAQHFREIEKLFRQVGFMPRIIAECESGELCHEMVINSVGAAIIQSTLVRTPYHTERVRYYAIRQDYPSLHLVALFRKHQYISRVMQSFTDMLKSR